MLLLSFFSTKDITINVIFILHHWYINANENKPNEAVPQFCKAKGIIIEICPGLNINEIQIPYDKHKEVSSLVKSYQNTHNSVKYEVI